MNRIFVAVSIAAVSIAASAQQSDLAGKWTGTVQGTQGNPLDLEVVLTGTSGTWRMKSMTGSGRNNPCLGREFPVVVLAQSDSELNLEVQGAKVLQGCMDQTATLKLVDPKTLDGVLKDGRPVKLAR